MQGQQNVRTARERQSVWAEKRFFLEKTIGEWPGIQHNFTTAQF